jgi:hypothetical protein
MRQTKCETKRNDETIATVSVIPASAAGTGFYFRGFDRGEVMYKLIQRWWSGG